MKFNVCDLNNYDMSTLMNIIGDYDKHLKLISESLNVSLDLEDGRIVTTDENRVRELSELFEEMLEIYRQKRSLESQDINSLLNNSSKSALYKKVLITGAGNRNIYLKTQGQKTLYEAFEKHDVTIVSGPAGTGKTFLAVVYAANLLKKGSIRKIIVTRPVVEAGESLGFLPGDLKEKVDPYLRPIYDSLEVIFGLEAVAKMIEKGIVEISPLAYMRGRTLNDAVIILDEAQNTTNTQMKMFLTRLGYNAKMIINGDITQIDLPGNKKSGLISAIEIVKDIEEIGLVEMHNNDIVRHPIVQKIIAAYERSKG